MICCFHGYFSVISNVGWNKKLKVDLGAQAQGIDIFTVKCAGGAIDVEHLDVIGLQLHVLSEVPVETQSEVFLLAAHYTSIGQVCRAVAKAHFPGANAALTHGA